MAKKASFTNGNCFEEDVSEIGDSKIIKSQEIVNEDLVQALNLPEDGKENRAVSLLSLIFLEGNKKINKSIERIEEFLLEEPLTSAEKSKLRDLFIEDEQGMRRTSIYIEFFKDNDLLNSLKFDAVLKLFYFKLTKKQLENLINMADAGSQRDIEVNGILEEMNDKKILSDNITNKVVELKKIEGDYESDMLTLDMIFDIKDYILLKDIVLSKQLIKKIRFLIESEVCFSIKNLKALDKFEIDENFVGKLNLLKDKVSIYFNDFSTIQKMDVDKKLIKKIDILNKLGIRLYGEDLLKIQKLTENDINKLKYIKKSLGKNLEYFGGLDFALTLEIQKIDKIILDIRKLGLKDVSYFGVLYNIPDKVLQYCVENKITDKEDIKKIKAMYSITNRESIKDYLHRKNEYLKKNRTISQEKYEEYFGGKGKFGKHEINQGDIGLCYLYSGLEILKKMNGFAELIQSNFVKKDNGWLVKLPFNNGKWINVNKNEIDGTYEYEMINYKWGISKIRKMNINSISEYLGFKILEIAYIKNKLINELGKSESLDAEGNGEIGNPLDIEITGERLKSVEGGHTIKTLQEILSEEKIIKGNIRGYNEAYRMLQRLKKCRAPEPILKNRKDEVREKGNRMDMLFSLYPTGFISINLSSRDTFHPLGKGIEKVEGKETYFLVSGVGIVDKSGQEIPQEKMEKFGDIVQDEGGNKMIKIITNHAYTVEKCYIDGNGEKKVRVVNPWHTGIKFDLSLNQCKKLFDWKFGVINIDELFK